MEPDENQAIFWLTKAAEQDFIDAQYSLSQYYARFDDPTNLSLSTFWMTRAAQLGHSDAQNMLAYRYHIGYGVEKDIDQALYWSEQAAITESKGE